MWTLYVDLVHGKLHAGVITYFLLAILYYTFLYHARLRRAEEHRAGLAAQLATAQMNALKMQLHPHFLFNTLNAITSLIHTDPEAADRMTTRLGDMLRTTLDLEGVQEVTLAQELDMLSDYLEICAMRFSDRLQSNSTWTTRPKAEWCRRSCCSRSWRMPWSTAWLPGPSRAVCGFRPDASANGWC